MDKVLVEIFLPAANASYDVRIPLHSRMSEILQMVSKLLGDLSAGKYLPADDSVLCDRDSGEVLNINLTAAESGLRNGSRLMLV